MGTNGILWNIGIDLIKALLIQVGAFAIVAAQMIMLDLPVLGRVGQKGSKLGGILDHVMQIAKEQGALALW